MSKKNKDRVDKPDAERFVARLQRLDPGDRAKLKRNAGNTLNDSRSVMGLFYGELLQGEELSALLEDVYFLVATLFPFERIDKQKDRPANSDYEPDQVQAEQGRPINFGASYRLLREAELSKQKLAGKKQQEEFRSNFDKRFGRLLDADLQQLPYYLRREVKFLTDNSRLSKCIDWGQLLIDLSRWSAADRTIQRKWARTYYAQEQSSSENQKSSKAT